MGALQESRDPGSANPVKPALLRREETFSLGFWGTSWVGEMFPPPGMFKLGDQQASSGLWLGPHLVIRGAQEIVTSGVEAEACHSTLMGPNNLYTRGIWDRPNPDGGIWGGRKHQLLKGKQRQDIREMGGP